MKNVLFIHLFLFSLGSLIAQSELQPRLWVLAVGVSEYKDAELNLTFAHSDASAIADSIREKALKSGQYAQCTVKKLLNSEANQNQILTTLADWKKSIRQKDLVIIYWAGHYKVINEKNVLLMADFQEDNTLQTTLSVAEITQNISTKSLFLIDQPFVESSEKVQDSDINTNVSHTVYYASSTKEYAYEKPSWGHSAFAKAILEGFTLSSDANKDNKIYFMEFSQYIANRIPELTKGKQHPIATNPQNILLF